MAQQNEWEREYQDPLLITKKEEPQSDTLDFFRYIRRKKGVNLSEISALDLGCGTGRNSNYLATLGARVIGYEISNTALTIAKERAAKAGLTVQYEIQNIGEPWPISDNSIDLILDVLSSNSLNDSEREIYLREASRVLKQSGFFYVKALAKDGDHNAKELLKLHPGPEKDTYRMPDMNITERVWSKEDFINTYSKFFSIIDLRLKTNYSKMNGRIYKRNYWMAYLSGSRIITENTSVQT